jgi:glycerol 3-phosphatase-2
MLGSSDVPLQERHDLAMLDLDGVVYVGGDAVPGAPEHLRRAREAGLRLAFITNNAARAPERVAEHLTDLGVDAAPEDVVTSAQAAAQVLVDRWGTDAAVVLLGSDGLRSALVAVGLRPVGVEDEADAVATGYGPDVLWRDIMRVAVRVREGLPWVASNRDHTIPTAYGVAPGHGVLVETIERFSGVTPTTAGKPERPLLDETIRRVGGERPLMVGDRLDTDIEGARNAGIDSLLVLTGVTGLDELVAARPGERPTYLSRDLGGLAEGCEAPCVDGDVVTLGGWTATVVDGRLDLRGDGTDDDWWRVTAVAGWRHLDATGSAVDTTGLEVPGRGHEASGG